MKKSEANIEDLRNQTVSWGTHRPDDLIPKFMAVLKEYGKEAYDKYVSENPEVVDWKMLDDETKGWVVDELFDLLDGIAPEDCYFGAHPGDGADFGFWQVDESKRKDSKKFEAEGNKDIYTLDLTRIDAEGDEEGLDDMQAAQNFYDEDEAIQAAKDLADSYKNDDDVVQVTVMAGEQEKPNGDIVGEPFDIFTASSSDSATTAKYREKAGYAKTDGLDYYAKGGKSEAKKSIGRDQFIKDVLELADAEKQKYYRDELVSFARGCYDHGETSVDKVLSDYFADTNESKKSEGEDDKGCESKDCKDDTTKKNEADAPFKVGDFVTYDAASDGKEDFINQYVSAEIAEINGDGSLVLWIYDLDDGGNDVKDADPQFCTKLDHFAGKVDAGHYYMDGPYKAYKGGWEILITKKDLNPRVYEFIGTMDDLGEVLDVDAYYGGENFVYDQELEGAVEQQGWAADEMDYADMSGDLAKAVRDSDESKKSEAMQNEGWTGGFGSRQEILDLMDGGIFTDDWKLEKRFGNWGCYVNQKTGRPIVLQMLIEPDNDHGWAYKSVTSDMGPYDINIQAAKWLKPRLEKWVEENPDKSKDVPGYEWEWIEKCLGKAAATKSKKDIAASLVKGDKVKLIDTVANGAVVTFIEMMAPGKMRILYNGREMSCKTSYIDRKVDAPAESKKSERAIPVSGAIKQKINDGITQCLSAIKEAGAVANPIKVTNSTDKPELSTRDTLVYAPSYVYRESGMERNFVGVMFHVEKDGKYGQLFIGWDKKNNRPFVWAGGATFDSYDSFCNDFKRDFSECFKTTESKKSESLTLKQKELKNMARYGEATDITTISDAEAKELKKKGIETVGISRGAYGMNGALLRDNEGNKYVITARSSNLFYFV